MPGLVLGFSGAHKILSLCKGKLSLNCRHWALVFTRFSCLLLCHRHSHCHSHPRRHRHRHRHQRQLKLQVSESETKSPSASAASVVANAVVSIQSERKSSDYYGSFPREEMLGGQRVMGGVGYVPLCILCAFNCFRITVIITSLRCAFWLKEVVKLIDKGKEREVRKCWGKGIGLVLQACNTICLCLILINLGFILI